MKFNIDFSFIIAILVLVQLFFLSSNVGSEETEDTDEVGKIKDEKSYAKVNNNAYIFENEGNSKVNEIKEKMLV
jgi:hypothetical protein